MIDWWRGEFYKGIDTAPDSDPGAFPYLSSARVCRIPARLRTGLTRAQIVKDFVKT